MKFVRGFAVASLTSGCLSLAIACGSPVDSGLFSERGGAPDRGVAGAERATAGSDQGVTPDDGGTGGTSSGVAGHPGNGSAGKDGAGSPGASGSAEGGGMNSGRAGATASAGATSTAAGAAGGVGTAGTVGANAGSGGTAGVSAGTGGSASGGGGVSGWSGWSGSSGWNGWSGSNGWSGAGGATACPSTPPQKGEICDVTTPNSCFYAGQACSCLASSGGGINPPKRWACYGDGAVCPDTKPIAGASCKQDVDVECPYPDNDFCFCSGNNFDARWVCQAEPPVCAANKPNDPSCSAVKTCSWGSNKEVACFCNGDRWGCEGGF